MIKTRALAKVIQALTIIIFLGFALSFVIRHFHIRWKSLVGIRPSIASQSPKIGSTYPAAGWVPYRRGPFVTTVAEMYGSNPMSSCRLGGGFNGTCLTANSGAVVQNLWGNNPHTFDTLQMVLGGTEYYKKIYEKGAVGSIPYFESKADDPSYSVICDSAGYPAICDHGTVQIPLGAVPETAADHHMFVRNSGTGLDWQTWVSPIPDGNLYKPYTANSQKFSKSEGLGFGGTAGNFATSWSVRPEDILAGRIPHALLIRVTCDTTVDGKRGSFVYPVMPGQAGNAATDNNFFCGTPAANSTDQDQWRPNSDSSVNLEYGAHLWSDISATKLPKPTIDGSNGCDIIAYAELKALNEFGAYVSDIGAAKYFHGPIYIDHAADISDTYTGNPSGTHSYWQDILEPLTGDEAPAIVDYALRDCGVDLANHLHVLIPPRPN